MLTFHSSFSSPTFWHQQIAFCDVSQIVRIYQWKQNVFTTNIFQWKPNHNHLNLFRSSHQRLFSILFWNSTSFEKTNRNVLFSLIQVSLLNWFLRKFSLRFLWRVWLVRHLKKLKRLPKLQRRILRKNIWYNLMRNLCWSEYQ